MDSTRSIRQGQIEVGIIEHEGHQFSAYGSMTCGRQVNGYLKYKCGRYWLTRWSGEAMLYRGEIVERFWNGAFALMFRLPKKRFLVGYGLGDGALFRGELIDGCDEDENPLHVSNLPFPVWISRIRLSSNLIKSRFRPSSIDSSCWRCWRRSDGTHRPVVGCDRSRRRG